MNNEQNTTRANILVGLFFCIMIAGMAGSVFFYKKARHNEAALIITRDSIRTAYLTLDSTKKLVEEERNRNQAALDKIDSLIGALSKTHSEAALQPVIKVVKAADFERQGYEALQQKDFTAAKAAFKQSEDAYNGYHNSYEIYNLLNKNNDTLKTSEGQQKVLQTIQTRYNIKAPVKLINASNPKSPNH